MGCTVNTPSSVLRAHVGLVGWHLFILRRVVHLTNTNSATMMSLALALIHCLYKLRTPYNIGIDQARGWYLIINSIQYGRSLKTLAGRIREENKTTQSRPLSLPPRWQSTTIVSKQAVRRGSKQKKLVNMNESEIEVELNQNQNQPRTSLIINKTALFWEVKWIEAVVIERRIKNGKQVKKERKKEKEG